MLKQSVMLAVVLTLTSLALAQGHPPLQTGGGASSPAATQTCDVTYSSGSNENATSFCVTVNGNLPQFTIAGGGTISNAEGYGICDATSGGIYYDWAYEDSSNWETATLSQSGNLVTVTRTTSDGIWQLTQKISNVNATSSGPGSAKVSMTLKNLSTANRSAYILRWAQVAPDFRLTNDYDYTQRTAYGIIPGSTLGLGSTNNTFKVNVVPQAFIMDTILAPNPCTPFANLAPRPFVGSGSIVQSWFLTVGNGKTVTVTSTYKPI
jgi:hypothetical protein